ncbi:MULTISPECIES: hypothetical protein [Rhizobium]|uniref:Uncharacterized protein n=1 Tax=Rhizobium favelukesii TaxID=348824 RepID=W6RN69_9HYPH|nr:MULTISPECIES: hypothetical protein [Rhizobium]MCA0801274.1 hypothetical protein [Rhizobium sp. T1473]MCS0463627.1 hypothetical protein [Rhizobium favelukesii]UFS80378.1 hypothetical protein LPB79_03795 [Rhizobium sp. T136]CDM62199.1 hypothetical protein LPU83_pLPU83d_0829 [Rhizobium favelukesii]
MIPSSLFYDLIDSQIAFKIVQRNFNSPNFIFSVPRAKDGQLRLTILGSQALVGSADAILARLNALLCEHPAPQPQHSFRQATVNGKVISYSLFPEAEKGKQHGLPEELSVECRLMPADHPSPDRETVLVNVIVEARHSLHLMERLGKDNFQEISRLSPHALPREIHQKLAANGYYEQSFVTLYGEEALEEAKTKLKDACDRWVSADGNVQHARH